MRFCINCGKQIKDEAVFCPHCGNMVDREDNNVTVTITDAPPVSIPTREKPISVNVSDAPPTYKAAGQRPQAAPQQPQTDSFWKRFWKKYGSCLSIIIIVFLVFLGIYIYGRIVGPTDVDDSERFLPNRLPAPQEQVR